MEQHNSSGAYNAGHLSLAVEMATRAHATMLSEGEAPLPYIAHPFEVLMNLRYIGEVTDAGNALRGNAARYG